MVLFCCFLQKTVAQECPPNIDFELGDFSNWTCYTGNVSVGPNLENIITLQKLSGPKFNRQTLFSAKTDRQTNDYFGGFPVLCPNGSNYSVKLGNNQGGAQAEGLSYEFTIPSNQNSYFLVYNYAVVFQDPDHSPFQQPRLELEITNVTDNSPINCPSLAFIPNGAGLPGFYKSPIVDPNSTPVWCKDWSAVTVNLNGLAGKKIRMLFKTADCTFSAHFGYAYLDINAECSSEFVGASYCHDDTAVNIVAPYGYQNYKWFNHNFTQVLGSSQTMKFEPPPPVGSKIAVELTPFNGYGCLDTLFAILYDTLNLKANAGQDLASCNGDEVQIGENPKAGVQYHWLPENGLSNPRISNPLLIPESTTQYILTLRNYGGGCRSSDTVQVIAYIIDSSLMVNGKTAFCTSTNDSAILFVNATDSVQWYKDDIYISNANALQYKVNEAGNYYALLYDTHGCKSKTRIQNINIEMPIPGLNYPVKYAIKNVPLDLESRPIGKTFFWNPSFNLNTSNAPNPIFNSSFEQEYSYKIDIITEAGCLTVDTQKIFVIKEIKLHVPTAFTPNGDGLNDYLKPALHGFKQLNYFKIFNRNGQLIFDLQQNQNGWDGKINNKLQDAGTYVWVAQAIGIDDKIHIEKGTTVLMR